MTTSTIQIWFYRDNSSSYAHLEIEDLEGDPATVRATAEAMVQGLKRHYPEAKTSRIVVESAQVATIELQEQP